MVTKKTLEHYLRQLRLIEEHREKTAERNIKVYYKKLMTDLQEFLGVEYAKLAQDDKLTHEILHAKGQHARFIEEVEKRINTFSPKAAQEIRNTVRLTYKKCFEGMVDAVEKSDTYEQLKLNLKGLRAVTPDVIKNAVSNKYMEKALEKNHKATIYDIKQQIGIGLSQGDRMSTMARRISDELGKGSRRSIMIARTECHRVREAGMQDSSARIYQKLKDSDSDYVMVKTWKTMQDFSVRPYRLKGKKGKKSVVKGKGPDHTKMHGVTVLVDEKFDLGDGVKAISPGQSGVAGHDINCRCYTSKDLMLKSEYEKMSGKKLEPDDPAKPYELKEQQMLKNKEELEKQKNKLEQRKTNLESYEYENIWKEKVTVKDYEAKKDRIDAKLAYYQENIYDAKNRVGKFANTTIYSDKRIETIIKSNEEFIEKLKNFEAQGKAYTKILGELTDVDKGLVDLDDQLKAVRQKIMKLKGIDVDKMQEEIDDLLKEINNLKKLKSTNNKLTLDSEINNIDKDEFNNALKKALDPDSELLEAYDDVFEAWSGGTFNDILDEFQDVDDIDEIEAVFKKLINSSSSKSANVEKIAELEKTLSTKQNALDKIKTRYNLYEDAFSQARKDAAYWFTDSNGGAEAADRVYRYKAGEVWRRATQAQKESAYRYTHTYSCYNEPLRGIEYGTSKFLGVGKVDMDTIGMSYKGYKKGQVKEWINDLTDYIDQSKYDHDIWLNRGCKRSGMDKFFNIKPSDFNLSEKELAAKIMGTTPTEYGFMSTGVAKGSGFGGEIKLNIYAPKGTKMAYVEPFSHFGKGAGKHWDGYSKQVSIGYEAEMLLQRNTKFRVIKVEKSGSQWYIDLEVISQQR